MARELGPFFLPTSRVLALKQLCSTALIVIWRSVIILKMLESFAASIVRLNNHTYMYTAQYRRIGYLCTGAYWINNKTSVH